MMPHFQFILRNVALALLLVGTQSHTTPPALSPWHKLRQQAREVRDEYATIYNLRAASDEYGTLGFIDAEKLFNDGFSGQNYLVQALLSTPLFATIVPFLQRHTAAVLTEISAVANPLTVTTREAMMYMKNVGAVVGIAQALFYYQHKGHYPYRTQAIAMMKKLVEKMS